MDDPARLDSATALARTPLFSHLGRLERARLAGELEEFHFAPGQAIVKEGDPADGCYVIKSGEVDIVTAEATGAPVGRLGPGEVFGEMALLTDSRRSASVVARGPVTAWRLSRVRFEALLGQERAIAHSIERALSHRLAVATHEAGAYRAAARRLAAATAAGLSPAATRLCAAVAARPSWDAAAPGRACDATGTAPALAELQAVPGLLRSEGAALVVDGTLALLLTDGSGVPDPAWIRAAAAELEAAGDPVGALELALGAGALDHATRLVADGAARLAEAASVADVDRWLARAGTGGLAEPLSTLRARIAARASLAQAAAVAPAATAAGPVFARTLRRLAAPRLLGGLAALAILALACWLPLPEGLTRAGLVGFGAIVAMVPLLILDVLPDYVVMLFLAVVLVVPGLVPAEQVLAGFATPAWLMILTLLVVGTAISRSGLMFRLVLLSLERLPAGYVTQSLVLAGSGVLLTAGLTSTVTRIALGVPIARGIADALGFARQSPGAAALGLLTFFTFSQMGELFLTGTFTGLVVQDLLPEAARRQVTWRYWFLVALPTFTIVFGAVYATTLLLFRPQSDVRVNLDAIRLQRQVLGPLTREEVWSALVLVGLVLGFATRPLHGIAPAWLAILAFLLLSVVGVLGPASLQSGGTLGLLVYAGVILSLGGVFTTLGIDTWLADLVRSGMPGWVANPYGFVLVVALVAFVLHFFVPWMTASTLLALVTMPIAEALGFHPFIAVLVALIGGDHTVAPYVNSSYAITYFASEGELFTHAQARPMLWLEALFRLLALLLSVPIWQLMGLM